MHYVICTSPALAIPVPAPITSSHCELTTLSIRNTLTRLECSLLGAMGNAL